MTQPDNRPHPECDCNEKAPRDCYWVCPKCDAEWHPEEHTEPRVTEREIDDAEDEARQLEYEDRELHGE